MYVKKPRKKKYLNNEDLLKQYHLSIDQNAMTEELAKMLLMMTKRFSQKGNFAGYSYIDDMQSHALLNLCNVWHKFNPEKSNNPFAYFTQCITFSFYSYLNKEKRVREIRDRELVFAGLDPSATFIANYEEDQQNLKQHELNVESQ